MKTRSNSTESSYRGYGLAAILLGVASWIAGWTIDPQQWLALGIVCIASTVLVGTMLLRHLGLRGSFAAVDPIVLLSVMFVFYFLIGPLLLVFGPEEHILWVMEYVQVSAGPAVSATGMNMTGLGIVLVTSSFVNGSDLTEKLQPTIRSYFSDIQPFSAFAILMAVGIYGQFAALQADFAGMNTVASGFTRMLAFMTDVSIFLAFVHQGRHATLMRLIGLVVAVTETVFGVLLFSKVMIFFPWATIAFATYLRTSSRMRAFTWGITLMLGLSAVGSPITNARESWGEGRVLSLDQRIETIKEVFRLQRVQSEFGSELWIRICYVHVQAAAMRFYENGTGGDDLELLPWLIAPRALFPDKPIITRSGLRFHDRVSASGSTSATGIGLFASGYYNLGIPGLIIVSALAGLMLSWCAALSRAIFSTQAWILMPFALVATYMGMRVDGHFIADYAGIFVGIFLPLAIILTSLKRPQFHSAGVS
jgi:hypothetical protein